MLARLSRGTISLVIWAVLMWAGHPAHAGNLSADEYLALRKSLGAVSPEISSLKENTSAYIGVVVDLKGMINGIVKCGDSMSFILDCGGESLTVKADEAAPDCISNGNTLRALIRVGPGSIASLSDLKLAGAAFEYDVSAREKALAAKARANKPQAKAAQRQAQKSPAPKYRSRSVRLSSRAMQIYDPYKKAIARFNPKLSGEQLDAITTSILVFSEHYGIDPRLVVALILAESGFRPNATSPKGAMGLGQLMPGTARGLGVGNAYDPVQNIEASVRLMRNHLGKYGDLALALSAYNAGSGAVRKYGGVPPYRETRNYIRKVSQIYKALCGK